MAAHSQGNIQLTIENNGSFAYGNKDFENDLWLGFFDPITGDSVYGCIYPRGSGNKYIDIGYLAIGAISGKDTLVSVKTELNPGAPPLGEFRIESINRSQPFYSPTARSELDLICEYTDTVTDPVFVPPDPSDLRYHKPMGIKVTQRSMAWSASMADDFIMIDYDITNIGDKHLQQLFIGLDCYTTVGNIYGHEYGGICGFMPRYTSFQTCSYTDTLNLAYIRDNDGNPQEGKFTQYSPLGAVGVMLLGASADSLLFNFNWRVPMGYEPSWGPRRQGTRDLEWIANHVPQWPQGEGNRYYVLSHPEVDYNQLYSAIDHTLEGWMPPVPESKDIAVAAYPSFLLSFGPFDLGPGDQMNFTIAIVGGDNVHRSPTAYRSMFSIDNPTPFYNQLDFSELAENARWAKKVYDNPGVDTDHDGYAGEFEICDGDTIWTKGDGVPDFRAGTPPPAPFVRVIPSMGRLVIRWNGYFSENYVDPFSRIADYEGYRVYVGLDNRRPSLTLLASYDRLNFKQFKYTLLANGEYQWKNRKPPFLLDSLKIIFNDSSFDPISYSRTQPLQYNGEYYYFEAVDHNMYDLSSQSGIHKVYPDATDPGDDSTLWTDNDITSEHGRPLPKFYEYEYIYDGILPTVEYFVAVTAFDFGFAGGNIAAQESNPLNSYQRAVAQLSADSVEAYGLDAYVYPNPYRVDADYPGSGYENRGGKLIPNRARLIHFANLPNVCDIYIYTIDGDLVRRLAHSFPEGGPTAMHETWDLINRNVQAVESGLYYWVVESATRTQIGKLAIIK